MGPLPGQELSLASTQRVSVRSGRQLIGLNACQLWAGTITGTKAGRCKGIRQYSGSARLATKPEEPKAEQRAAEESQAGRFRHGHVHIRSS
jgi:hypothetical protein